MWLARRLGAGHGPTTQSSGRPADLAAYTVQDAPAELVTVRLPDGRVVQGERTGDASGAGPRAADNGRPNPTMVLLTPPDGPRPPRRHWYSWIPRWVRWTGVIVILVLVFRRIVAWAVLGRAVRRAAPVRRRRAPAARHVRLALVVLLFF